MMGWTPDTLMNATMRQHGDFIEGYLIGQGVDIDSAGLMSREQLDQLIALHG